MIHNAPTHPKHTNRSVVDVLEEALAAETGRELGRLIGSVPVERKHDF